MAQIYCYDNFGILVDEVLSETGHYEFVGLGLDPGANARPFYKALCDNYMLKFRQAMSLYPWRFASVFYYLEYDDTFEPTCDGFVSSFTVPLSAGNWYDIWGVALRDDIEFSEKFVAKKTTNGKVLTNYEPDDDDDEDNIISAWLVQEPTLSACPFYFTELYKNLLKQFIGNMEHDINGTATLALKEYPVVFQNAVAQDNSQFACNTTFKFEKKSFPTW
jgi:hypothetical protein